MTSGKIYPLFSEAFITNYSAQMLAEIGFGQEDLAALSRRLSDRLEAEVVIREVHARAPGPDRAHWVVIGKPNG